MSPCLERERWRWRRCFGESCGARRRRGAEERPQGEGGAGVLPPTDAVHGDSRPDASASAGER
eukprot:14490184-Alexandrium_andersonii.AAC.1